MRGIITQANYIEKLKKHNEKALEYVIRTYGGYVKTAVHRNLAGHPEEMEECMDDVQADENVMEFTEAEALAYIKRFKARRTHRHGVT